MSQVRIQGAVEVPLKLDFSQGRPEGRITIELGAVKMEGILFVQSYRQESDGYGQRRAYIDVDGIAICEKVDA